VGVKMENVNDIQYRSREVGNIKLLKLRDILYDKAKKLNKIVILLSIIPIIYTIIVNNFNIIIFNSEKVLGIDEFGVIIALIVSSIITILSSKINNYKLDSNILRQAYDCRVFKIRGNKFIIPEKTKIVLENTVIDKNDKKRYENWYDGEMTNNWCCDVLICQIDNLLYTMYLYSRLKKIMDIIIWGLIISILALISYGLFEGIIIKILFKFIVPIFPMLTIVFTTWTKLKNNIYDYENKMETIKEDARKNEIDNIYLESIQDKILINRLNDVLVPKVLREFYLKPGNEYKLELKKFNDYIIELKIKNVLIFEDNYNGV
jgi:hypothetical protein